ncbi:MAG TPA: 2-hydroxyacid dehydrogenase [Candidatus Saccharimonadales bacterium]|nr:2-hydroxyacid dehydrogenase [Candidatus Saccharimonadales bacterium]
MKIVFPDRIDFDAAAKAKIKELGITTYDDTPTDENIIIERIRDAELITANFIDVPRTVIDAAPNLQFIISSAVGYNHIDHKYAASKGIKVLNCPTQNAEAVAEHAIALMLAVSRRIVEASTDLRSGAWNGLDMLGTELSRKKLGLIGYGQIGKLIEQKVSGFNMIVSYANSASSDQELDALLQDSDIICLCLASNDDTWHIIDRRRLSLLRPHAILINVARGGVIDQAALLEALKQKAFRGAGLDVYENEPASGDVPAHILELAKLPNVIATPHIAYNTEETIARLGEELFKNIESCLNGNPVNVVNN